MARKKKKAKIQQWSQKALAILICLAVLAGAAIAVLYIYTDIDHDNIIYNVTVAGVDVGGISKDEAMEAVENATAGTYTEKSLLINIDGHTHKIAPESSGAKLDVEAAVTAAYNYGRTGFVIRRYREQDRAKDAFVAIDITDYLHLDTAALQAEAAELCDQYNCSMIQHQYRLEGESDNRALILTAGQTGYSLNQETLYQQILDAYNQNTLSFTAECGITRPDALDLEGIAKEHCIAPIDATMDKTTYVITEHKDGYGFRPIEAKNALRDCKPGEEVTIPFKVLTADVTREDLEKDLYKDLLSEYTAKFGSNYNRDVNLKLSCQAVNGTVLLPGEVFDYNSTVGERTPEAGYKLGNTYAGMETIQTYGGGICQTSSTLYYCALMADLEIVYRINHGFISDYVPFGMDATVSWGGPEFQFKNNSPYPIRIEAYAEGGNVTVKLWGTDHKDYYVKMEYEVLGVYNWKTITKEMYADNANGYKNGQVLTSPYTGYKIQTYRCKYRKSDDMPISKEPEALSSYSSRNKVVVKIIEKPSPEPTPQPDAS